MGDQTGGSAFEAGAVVGAVREVEVSSGYCTVCCKDYKGVRGLRIEQKSMQTSRRGSKQCYDKM